MGFDPISRMLLLSQSWMEGKPLVHTVWKAPEFGLKNKCLHFFSCLEVIIRKAPLKEVDFLFSEDVSVMDLCFLCSEYAKLICAILRASV